MLPGLVAIVRTIDTIKLLEVNKNRIPYALALSLCSSIRSLSSDQVVSKLILLKSFVIVGYK